MFQQTNRSAFTLVELLVSMAIIAILAALLLLGISRAKASARTAVCKNHLGQIGRALAMYVADEKRYPPLGELQLLGPGKGASPTTWADRLFVYAPLSWTNDIWHCPTYLAQGGVVQKRTITPRGLKGSSISTSYAYNAMGMVAGNRWPKLGLGPWVSSTAPEDALKAPSEMFTVADSRAFKFSDSPGLTGLPDMQPWLGPGGLTATRYGEEGAAPHADGYDVVFGDCHVSLSKRKDYLFPPRSAHNWNRDNEPHGELWAAKSEWVVKN